MSRKRPGRGGEVEVVCLGGAEASELIFVVEEAPDGGYIARALGAPISTGADRLDRVPARVREAIRWHFEPDGLPSTVRLHYVREEVIRL